MTVKNSVDQANGYCFGSVEERNLKAMMSSGENYSIIYFIEALFYGYNETAWRLIISYRDSLKSV